MPPVDYAVRAMPTAGPPQYKATGMTTGMPACGIGKRPLRMIQTKSGIASWAALCGAILLSACATRLGPRTIPAARFDYNERIARSHTFGVAHTYIDAPHYQKMS